MCLACWEPYDPAEPKMSGLCCSSCGEEFHYGEETIDCMGDLYHRECIDEYLAALLGGRAITAEKPADHHCECCNEVIEDGDYVIVLGDSEYYHEDCFNDNTYHIGSYRTVTADEWYF